VNDGDQQEISRPPEIKDIELSAVSSCTTSSSCENDEQEEDLFQPDIDIEETGNSSSANFLDSTASSWLQNSYGCPAFFNRGWFSQSIRPPFFTLQGDNFNIKSDDLFDVVVIHIFSSETCRSETSSTGSRS
jgi:hypothetical protein